MSRRRRCSQTSVIVLSLSLCAVAAGAWLFSYCDGVFSSDGAVRILRLDHSPSGSGAPAYPRARPDGGNDVSLWFDLRRGSGASMSSSGTLSMRTTPSSSWARLGFESHLGIANYEVVVHTTSGPMGFAGSFNFHLLAVPYWFILLLLALVPAGCGFAARRRQRRRRKGLCPRCAYDLRASTGRCPECGLRVRRRPTPEPAPVGAAS